MKLRPRAAVALTVMTGALVATAGAGYGVSASPGTDASSAGPVAGAVELDAATTTLTPSPTNVVPTGPTASAIVPTTGAVAPPTVGPSTTALPTVGISTLPPATVPAPAPPPQFSVAPHRTIETEAGRGAQFVPTVILAPSSQHDWLMIGDYRSNPGAVTQVVVYEAPATTPSQWSMGAFTGEEQPTSARTAVTLPDGSALIFGSADGAAGPSPAVWTYDGTALAGPTIVGPETPFGRVTAAAVAADGTVFAIVQRYTSGQRVTYELGKRTPDGSWTFTNPRLPALDVGISGIALVGTTIVLVGDGLLTENDPGYQARAFYSTDGGATFQLSDTTALASPARGTSLGAVTAGPDGFYAAACLAGSGATRQGIARSADGVTWVEVTFTGPAGVVPLFSAGCDEIVVDEEGGVWLGGYSSFENYVYRVLNGVVDRVAVAFVQGEQTPFDSGPNVQFGVRGGVIAAAVPQVGGSSNGFAQVASATNLDQPVVIEPVGVSPPGHEVISGLGVINDIGNVIGLETYPQLAPLDDGAIIYRQRVFPYTLSDVGQPTLAPAAAPANPDTGAAISGVVTLAAGEVAVASVADANPGDVFGIVGDVVVSRRPPGGEWSPLEVVLGGPGGQTIGDVTVVGGLVVAVGADLLTNETTNVDEGQPFVLFGDGTTFSRLDIDVGGSNVAQALSVCPMPDARALVIGYDRQSRSAFSALVDLTAGTVTVNEIDIEPAGAVPQRCVGAREGAFVEVAGSSFADGSLLYGTRDGITFDAVDVLAEDDFMYRIRSGAAGVAIVGITGPASEDAFVMFGPSIDAMQRIDVPGFVGAGVQIANDVVIGDGVLYVIGTINASPVVWPITIS